ncbi:MAG: precorrin-2 C(20)-methyltransferase [Prochlorococcus sp.]
MPRLALSSPAVSASALTLVGVGPGDPALLTVAAIDAIEAATVVAYPVARKGGKGMAVSIASRWIRAEQRQLPLIFPMVTAAEPRQQAWREASDQLAAAVAAGELVVFLCQGDASLFATSSYLLLALKKHHPDCPVRLIPGVTAVAAAAAAAGGWPLAMQQEQLLVLPTPDQASQLEILIDEAAASARVLALLKLAHRWAWVRPMLERRQLLQSALFAQRLGWPDQQVMQASEVQAEAKPYFSLLLVRQSWPEVMP